MNSVSRGTTDLVEQPIRITYTPGKGGSTTRTFTGNEANIRAEAIILNAAGWSTDIVGGPSWTLSATLSGNSDTNPTPEPQWEIVPHSIERNVLECTDRAFISNLSTNTKDFILEALKNPTTAEPFVDVTAGADEFWDAWTAYSLMKAGVEARQEFTISARRTITVSRNYTTDWTLTNNGKVLSKNSLVSLYYVPDYVSVLLPDSDNAVQNSGTEDSPLYTFQGYLEQKPTYQSVAGNQIQISQEWVFNRWSAGERGLYDVV